MQCNCSASAKLPAITIIIGEITGSASTTSDPTAGLLEAQPNRIPSTNPLPPNHTNDHRRKKMRARNHFQIHGSVLERANPSDVQSFVRRSSRILDGSQTDGHAVDPDSDGFKRVLAGLERIMQVVPHLEDGRVVRLKSCSWFCITFTHTRVYICDVSLCMHLSASLAYSRTENLDSGTTACYLVLIWMRHSRRGGAGGARKGSRRGGGKEGRGVNGGTCDGESRFGVLLNFYEKYSRRVEDFSSLCFVRLW